MLRYALKIKGKENQEIQIGQYKEKSYRLLDLDPVYNVPIDMYPHHPDASSCLPRDMFTMVMSSATPTSRPITPSNVPQKNMAIYGKFGSATLIYCIGFPLSMFALLKYARRNTGDGREKKGGLLAGTQLSVRKLLTRLLVLGRLLSLSGRSWSPPC